MSIDTIFRDAPVPPRRAGRADFRGRQPLSDRTDLVERIRCRSCKARAVLLVEIDVAPRPNLSGRIRYYRCRTCRQVQILEVGAH